MILYTTPAYRIGRHEWRIEVREATEFDQNSVVPVWRRAGMSGSWYEPADFSGEWPRGLFKLTVEHITEIAKYVEQGKNHG